MFGLFKSKKKLQVRNPKADAEFLEAKKKIDDYILLKLKETREHFFFNEVMEILIEYKVVSYENRNKLKIKFLTTLESILTDDEKLLFARYYPFAQFELKVYRYFIKEIETLNILLKYRFRTHDIIGIVIPIIHTNIAGVCIPINIKNT